LLEPDGLEEYLNMINNEIVLFESQRDLQRSLDALDSKFVEIQDRFEISNVEQSKKVPRPKPCLPRVKSRDSNYNGVSSNRRYSKPRWKRSRPGIIDDCTRKKQCSIGSIVPRVPLTATAPKPLPALPNLLEATCGWLLCELPDRKWSKYYFVTDPASHTLLQLRTPESPTTEGYFNLQNAVIHSQGTIQYHGEMLYTFRIVADNGIAGKKVRLKLGIHDEGYMLKWLQVLRYNSRTHSLCTTPLPEPKSPVILPVVRHVWDDYIKTIEGVELLDTNLKKELKRIGMGIKFKYNSSETINWEIVPWTEKCAVCIQSWYRSRTALQMVFGDKGIQKRVKAVSVIQTCYRRYAEKLERQELQLIQTTVVVLQSFFRGSLGRKFVRDTKVVLDNATVIQCTWRSFVARQTANKRRQIIELEVQGILDHVVQLVDGNHEAYVLVQHQKQRRNSAVSLQCAWRGRIGRNQAVAQRQECASITIQCAFRKYSACRWVKKAINGFTTLQACFRGASTRYRERGKRFYRLKATSIQRIIRGGIVRIQVSRIYIAHNKIWRFCKNILGRKQYVACKKVISIRRHARIVIQSSLRMFSALTKFKIELRRFRNICLIQTWFRCFSQKKIFRILRSRCVKIQCFLRKYFAKNVIINLWHQRRSACATIIQRNFRVWHTHRTIYKLQEATNGNFLKLNFVLFSGLVRFDSKSFKSKITVASTAGDLLVRISEPCGIAHKWEIGGWHLILFLHRRKLTIHDVPVWKLGEILSIHMLTLHMKSMPGQQRQLAVHLPPQFDCIARVLVKQSFFKDLWDHLSDSTFCHRSETHQVISKSLVTLNAYNKKPVRIGIPPSAQTNIFDRSIHPRAIFGHDMDFHGMELQRRVDTFENLNRTEAQLLESLDKKSIESLFEESLQFTLTSLSTTTELSDQLGSDIARWEESIVDLMHQKSILDHEENLNEYLKEPRFQLFDNSIACLQRKIAVAKDTVHVCQNSIEFFSRSHVYLIDSNKRLSIVASDMTLLVQQQRKRRKSRIENEIQCFTATKPVYDLCCRNIAMLIGGYFTAHVPTLNSSDALLSKYLPILASQMDELQRIYGNNGADEITYETNLKLVVESVHGFLGNLTLEFETIQSEGGPLISEQDKFVANTRDSFEKLDKSIKRERLRCENIIAKEDNIQEMLSKEEALYREQMAYDESQQKLTAPNLLEESLDQVDDLYDELKSKIQLLVSVVEEFATIEEKKGFERQQLDRAYSKFVKLDDCLDEKSYDTAVKECQSVVKYLGHLSLLFKRIHTQIESDDDPDEFPNMIKFHIASIKNGEALLSAIEDTRKYYSIINPPPEDQPTYKVSTEQPVSSRFLLGTVAQGLAKTILGESTASKVAASPVVVTVAKLIRHGLKTHAIGLRRGVIVARGAQVEQRLKLKRKFAAAKGFIKDPFRWKSANQHERAVDIQRIFRGYRCRKKLRSEAATVIQCAFRSMTAWNTYKDTLHKSTSKHYDAVTGSYYYVWPGHTSWQPPQAIHDRHIMFGTRMRAKDHQWTDDEAARLVQSGYRARKARGVFVQLIFDSYEKIWEPSQEAYFYQNMHTRKCQWHKPLGLGSLDLEPSYFPES